MFETGVVYLDVAIGLAVVFFLLSLIPSGINEAIAFVTRIRSKFLWAYLNQLFTKEGGSSLPVESATAKAARFVPDGVPLLLPDLIAETERRAAARAVTADPAAAPEAIERSVAADSDVVALSGLTEVTDSMERSVESRAASASVGLPSTSWEMLRLMRARGTRDPRPTLGGRALHDEPPAGDEALPVVAELHRRLGPIAVAANAHEVRTPKADKPTTTKHIPARSLARALVGLLMGSGPTEADVAAKLDGLAGTPIHATLVSLWTSTSGRLKEFGDELEAWFDAEMARLSGLYKRLMRWVLGAAAVVVALCVNLDPFGLTRDLWRDPDRRAEFVAVAESATAGDGSEGADSTTSAPDQAAPSAMRELSELYAKCRAEASTTESTATTTATTIADDASTTTSPGDEVATAAAAVERLRNCVTDALDAQSELGLMNDSVWEFEAFKRTWGLSWNLGVLHVVKLSLVAAAIFFGAPFWWDVVRRLMGIRKATVKPET